MNRIRYWSNLCKLSLILIIIVLVGSLNISGKSEAQSSNRRIMFLSDYQGSWAIYTMQPNGTEVEQLIDVNVEEGGRLTSASLSPDGTRLAVSSSKDRGTGRAVDEIFIVDMITETVTSLTNDGLNNTFPRWSPDSQHLAYLSEGIDTFAKVYVMDFTTGTRQLLVTNDSLNAVVPHEAGPRIRQLDWSADGSQLVLSGQIGLPDVSNMLIVVNADGSNPRQITPEGFMIGPHVAWGSDSNLVFASCEQDENSEICLVNLQTLQTIVITDLDVSIPNVSNPRIMSLDIALSNEAIFSYGRLSPVMYTLNTQTGAITPITNNGIDFELLGWIKG